MPFPNLDEAKRIAMEFCTAERQPQMITIGKDGSPRVRTLGASLKPDWSIAVGARRSNGRALQLQRNPRVAFVYQAFEAPAKGMPPQVVVLNGNGRLGTIDEYQPMYDRLKAAGQATMSVEEAFETRTVLICQIDEVRLEGFSANGEALTFPEITSGMTFRVP